MSYMCRRQAIRLFEGSPKSRAMCFGLSVLKGRVEAAGRRTGGLEKLETHPIVRSSDPRRYSIAWHSIA